MVKCSNCGGPVTLVPDGDERYDSTAFESLRGEVEKAERERDKALKAWQAVCDISEDRRLAGIEAESRIVLLEKVVEAADLLNAKAFEVFDPKLIDGWLLDLHDLCDEYEKTRPATRKKGKGE